jgi:F-type H+-transporting ATPase subunit b
VEPNRDLRVAAALLAFLGSVGEAAASEGGPHVPEFELIPDLRLLPLLIAFFLALVPIVNRMLLRPMLRVLDARAERTEGARRRASRLEEQVRAVVARYEGRIRDVRQSAEASRREVLEDARRRAAEETLAARSDAETEIARARREVAAAFEEARRGLRAESEELAREAAARVLGRSVA